MISCLQKFDPIVEYRIYKAISFRHPARPDVAAHVLQWLRLANTFVRISHRGLDEIEHTQRDLSIGVYPVPQIIATLVLNHGTALAFCHLELLCACLRMAMVM